MMRWLKIISLAIAGLVALVVVAGLAYEQISRSLTRSAYPAHGQPVSVGDHSLNVRLKGDGGPLVVFESGLDQGGSMVWGKVQDRVALSTSTLSYDRAGIMWSERGGNPKTGEAMADELYTLLKRSGNKGPYILVGHSLAGYIFRSFAGKHASEVAGFVFVDASHPDQWKRMPPELDTPVPPSWIIQIASNLGAIRLFVPTGYPGISPQDSLNLIVGAYAPVSMPATLEEFRGVRSLADEAGRVGSFGDIPLIVITGTAKSRLDEYPSKQAGQAFLSMWGELQEDLLKLSTESKHVLAEKSGHFIMLDQPDVVIDAISELVARARARSDSSTTK